MPWIATQGSKCVRKLVTNPNTSTHARFFEQHQSAFVLQACEREHVGWWVDVLGLTCFPCRLNAGSQDLAASFAIPRLASHAAARARPCPSLCCGTAPTRRATIGAPREKVWVYAAVFPREQKVKAPPALVAAASRRLALSVLCVLVRARANVCTTPLSTDESFAAALCVFVPSLHCLRPLASTHPATVPAAVRTSSSSSNGKATTRSTSRTDHQVHWTTTDVSFFVNWGRRRRKRCSRWCRGRPRG